MLSLVHLASGREALSGPANLFEIYDDHPNETDAWDIDPFHLEDPAAVRSGARSASGAGDPLRVEIEFERARRHRQLGATDPAPRRRRAAARVPHPGSIGAESHRLL